ncbi:MAG: hypothetical protein HWE34_00040 [Methylocystaceae bacterium]|nr:hypothetical protein [Methylocystaceae bacterium]
MVDIFGPLSAAAGGQLSIFNVQKDVSTNQLNKQLQNNFQTRVQTEVDRINDSYASNLNSKDLEEESISRYLNDLSEGLDTIQNTSKRLTGMLDRLDRMIININKAQQSSDDPDAAFKPGGYAAAHDSYFRGLDDLIKNTRTSDNLLASDSASIRYPISYNGTSAQVYGNDLRTNYHIEDSNGNKWYPDQKTQLLKVYTDYPHTEGEGKSSMIYDQGLQLDSFSDPTVNFTTGANGVSPQSFTGTLKREGLSVLNAWLYDNLSTSAGRERALSDLNAAKESVKVEISRYSLVETTLDYYDKIASNRLHGVREERISIQAEAAEAISKKQSEMMYQYQSVQSSLAQALVVRNSYKNLFPNLANDPLTMRLMNVQV